MITTKPKLRLYIILLSFAMVVTNGFSINPEVSKYLINLSEGEEGPGYDDKYPEIVISGNTIHAVWTQKVSGSEAHFYYRRSTDLGETWEAPQKLMVYKNSGYGLEVNSRRLAVDGDVVHVCTADYDYDDDGTGKIHYFRSQNGGTSFESEQIIAATSGGYNAIDDCFIKASDGKVAVAYHGEGDKKGTWALFSSNGGTSFSDTKISDESNYVTDLYFDGGQMIVLHGYIHYSYGLLTSGKVWVSTSDNGTAFTTNKISVSYETQDGEEERCRVEHVEEHYSSKIARSGNNIHVVFNGLTEEDEWTTFYARSTNGGNSFEPATDIGAVIAEKLQEGFETVAAKNGNVYLLAATTSSATGSEFYFAYSHDNGTTFSEPRRIMNPDVELVGKASLPAIVIDPTDESGKTLYLTGNMLFSTKSVDGGQSFSGSMSLAPSLKGNVLYMYSSSMNSFMQIDNEGGLHWITRAEWSNGSDQDIFYRNVRTQPGPGTKNKAFYVENIAKSREKTDLVVVPSSESIQFDSAMTAEVWVKFDPESEDFGILAKVDGYNPGYNRPKGYQMGSIANDGAIQVNAGIQTDIEAPVILADIDLNDNLWHHIAFTYDVNGGLNNFKLYVNGLLLQQQTVNGTIVTEDGMLMLGARGENEGWYDDAKYYMDDVRLWNRALTQEELLENQTKKITGEKEGLTLFINFDDTFKDISGNGNDGIPVYNGTLNESDFDPPVPAFELYQQGNVVSFNNKTKNATSWVWDFGDGNTSEQGNPKHGYSNPGEYSISLLAKNANSVNGAVGHATIEGLEHIDPREAGNFGYATLTVFGGGLTTEGSSFLLRKNGAEISGDDLYSPAPGQLAGRFLMNGAELGEYDVVFKKNGAELILEDAFSVVEATMPEPWVSIAGRSFTLLNMWQTFTINYGNKGNVDALGVPLNIVVSDLPDLEVNFFDFKVEANEYMKTHTPEIVELMDTLYDVVEDYFGPGHNARFYPLYVPVLEANSSRSVHIRVKSKSSQRYYMEAWTNDPFFEFVDTETKSAAASQDDEKDMEMKLNACLALSAAHATSSSLMDLVGIVLPVDCVYDFATVAFNPWDKLKPDMETSEPTVFNNWGYSLASAAFSCIGDLSPFKAIKIGIKITSIVNNMYQGYLAHQECLNNFDPRYKSRKGVSALTSLDPNEMVGPSGFGEQNFIPGYHMMPYTILFENKSEATAPAHIVTVTDTLDLSVFDISEFGFSSFGWGDTIFSPPGNKLKEFSMDIDLRPQLELITRVSGKLDALTGVVKWEFLSLNPGTMNLEEDPFIGFLPPNVTPPEGDGFVSFSVGLKEELGTNDEIRNQATIVFDANEPIVTNEYLNTLDLDKPQSQVYPLEANIENRFPVDWTGTDEGSGISHYTIYVMENDTLLYPWQTNTSEITAEFIGEVGSTYKFYSIATDNVSHIEAAPNDYDAQTTVTVDVEEFERMKETLKVWPNPVKDNLRVTFSHAPCGMYVVELVSATGSVKHSQLYEDRELQNGISVIVSDCPPGHYGFTCSIWE